MPENKVKKIDIFQQYRDESGKWHSYACNHDLNDVKNLQIDIAYTREFIEWWLKESLRVINHKKQ